jgi:hypothetical protein
LATTTYGALDVLPVKRRVAPSPGKPQLEPAEHFADCPLCLERDIAPGTQVRSVRRASDLHSKKSAVTHVFLRAILSQ